MPTPSPELPRPISAQWGSEVTQRPRAWGREGTGLPWSPQGAPMGAATEGW